MTEILPKFKTEVYIESFKKTNSEAIDSKHHVELRDVLEGTMVYQEKHYDRAERLLRSAYFVDYLVSQMTLEEEE